jgi:hypothetical protein
MIAAEFARYLGLPVTRRANITDIIEAVCGVCTDTRTSVICVEIHNLNIAALDTSLRLHRHQPGSLSELAGYLHQRTGGMIGSLLWLIRSAAIQAVIDGTESITKKSMDAIPVDIASQAGRPSQGKL